MFLRRPTAHVQSDFGDHGEDRIGVEAMHLGQVHAGHAIDVLPHVEGRRVGRPLGPRGAGLKRLALALVLERLQLRLDLLVDLGKSLVEKAIRVHRLL